MVRLIDLTGLSAFIAIHCIQQSTNGGQLSGVKRVTTPSSTYQICSMQSRTGANGLFDQRGLSLGRPAFAIPFLLSISPCPRNRLILHIAILFPCPSALDASSLEPCQADRNHSPRNQSTSIQQASPIRSSAPSPTLPGITARSFPWT